MSTKEKAPDHSLRPNRLVRAGLAGLVGAAALTGCMVPGSGQDDRPAMAESAPAPATASPELAAKIEKVDSTVDEMLGDILAMYESAPEYNRGSGPVGEHVSGDMAEVRMYAQGNHPATLSEYSFQVIGSGADGVIEPEDITGLHLGADWVQKGSFEPVPGPKPYDMVLTRGGGGWQLLANGTDEHGAGWTSDIDLTVIAESAGQALPEDHLITSALEQAQLIVEDARQGEMISYQNQPS